MNVQMENAIFTQLKLGNLNYFQLPIRKMHKCTEFNFSNVYKSNYM